MNKKVVLRESKKIVITLGMVASLVACTKEKPQEVNNDNKAESTVSTENVSQTPILKMDGSVEFKYGAPVGSKNDHIEIGPNAYVIDDLKDKSVMDQDINYGFYLIDGKYVLRCIDGIGNDEVLAEYDSDCANIGYSEENIIYFTCNKKAYQYDIDKKESNIIESLGNYDIDKMYVVNDDVLVFSTGHEIFEYSVKEASIFKYNNEVEFTNFVPTSYGMVTCINEDERENSQLFIDNNRVFENVSFSYISLMDNSVDVQTEDEEFINVVANEEDKKNLENCLIEYSIGYENLKNDETFENFKVLVPFGG